MSEPDGKVLDANLALLLRRAYVPALPRPAFRERLAGEWHAEHRRLGARRDRARAAIVAGNDPSMPRHWSFPPFGLRPGFAAALAAAFLVMLGLWWLDREDAPRHAGPQELLARGAIALREPGQSSWSALDDEGQGGQGLRLGPRGLEVRTPEGRELRLQAAEGTLTLGERTHATIEPRGTAGWSRQVHLDGSLVAEHADAGGPWTIGDTRRSVRLDHGRLELVLRAQEAHALLERGAAALVVGGRTGPLSVGTRVPLDGDPLASAAGGDLAERLPLGPEAGEPSGDGTPDGEPGADPDADPDAGAGPFLVGTVHDAETGAPIGSFQVGLLRERQGNQIQAPLVREASSADGAFRCAVPGPGTYRVFVHAPGHALARLGAHSLDERAELDLGSIALARGGGLRGHVIDAASGLALADALVLSETDAPSFGLPFGSGDSMPWLPASARTGADGGFVLEHLGPGEHVLRISAAGHAPLWKSGVSVAEGEVGQLGTLSLEAGGRLAGRAERPDGTPFAGAELVVTLMDDSGISTQMNFTMAETDLEGRFAVEDLPEGQLLAVFLGDHSGPPEVRPITVRAGRTTTLDFIEEDGGTRLFGRVLRADGEPLGLRNLTLIARDAQSSEEDWQATTSGPEGRFLFEAVEPGPYLLLEVDSFGRWLALVDLLEVPDWPEFEWNARRPDTAIEGRSVIDAGGEPLARALILVERIEADRSLFAGFVVSDEDGRFALRELPPGRYALTSYTTDGALGYVAEEPFLLDEASPRHACTLRHEPGSSVEVSVVDEAGEPLEGALVSFLDERGRSFSFDRVPRTDARGMHLARGVRPERLRVQAELTGYRTGYAEILPRAGHRESVRIRLVTE